MCSQILNAASRQPGLKKPNCIVTATLYLNSIFMPSLTLELKTIILLHYVTRKLCFVN